MARRKTYKSQLDRDINTRKRTDIGSNSVLSSNPNDRPAKANNIDYAANEAAMKQIRMMALNKAGANTSNNFNIANNPTSFFGTQNFIKKQNFQNKATTRDTVSTTAAIATSNGRKDLYNSQSEKDARLISKSAMGINRTTETEVGQASKEMKSALPKGAYEQIETEIGKTNYSTSKANLEKGLANYGSVVNAKNYAKQYGTESKEDTIKRILMNDYGMDEQEASNYANSWDNMKSNIKTDDYYAKRNRNLDMLSDVEREDFNKLVDASYSHNQMPVAGAFNVVSKDYMNQRELIKNKYGYSDDELNKIEQYVREENDIIDTQQRNENIQNTLEEHPVIGGIGYNVANAVTSPVSGIVAMGENFKRPFYADNEAPVNVYSRDYALSNAMETAQAKTSDNIRQGVANAGGGEKLQDAAVFGYNAVSAAEESLTALAVGGAAASRVSSALGLGAKGSMAVANIVTLPSFGARSYTSTLKADQERGISTENAQKHAFVAGTAEMLTEIVSLDKAWSILQNGGKKALKNHVINALVEAGIEGSEEVTSDIASELADRFVNQNFSEYAMTVKKYGKEEADRRFRSELIQDFLAGAVSGGMIGAGASVVSSYNYNKSADNILNEDDKSTLDKVVKAAETMDEGTEAREIVTNKATEELDKKDVAKILKSINEESNTDVEESLKNRFVELGEDEKEAKNDAKIVLDAITSGGEVSEEESDKRVEQFEANDNLSTVYADALKGNVSEINSMDAVGSVNALNEENRANKTSTVNRVVNTAKAGLEALNGKLSSVSKVSLKTGQEAIAVEYAKVDGNTENVKLSNGNVVPISEITFNNSAQEELYTAASSMGNTKAANTFMSLASAEDNMSVYKLGMKMAYYTGMTGKVSFDSFINNPTNQQNFVKDIEVSKLKTMYLMGQNIAAEEAQNNKAKQNEEAKKYKEVVKDKEKPTVKDARADKSDKTIVNAAQVIAAWSNTNITLKQKIDTPSYFTGIVRGQYTTSDNTITLSAEANNEYSALWHEVTEKLSTANAKAMDDILAEVIDFAQSTKGAEYLNQKIEQYKGAYETLEGSKSQSEAAEEYARDILADMMATEEGVNQLNEYLKDKGLNATERKTFWQKIVDVLDSIINAIKDYVDSHNISKESKAIMDADLKRASEIRQRVFELVDEVAQIQGFEVLTDEVRNSIQLENVRTENLGEYNFSRTVAFTGTDEEVEAAEKTEAEIDQKIKDIITRDDFVYFEYAKDGAKLEENGDKFVISNSTRGKKWQVTFFDKKGAWGHELFDNADKLIGSINATVLFGKNREVSYFLEEDMSDTPAEGSIKFSIQPDNELIAVHNTTEDKLIKTLKLGGLPMPSIAITKARIGHSNFGDYTFVFTRDTIDPKLKANKVYGADAWTPTFPRVEYEPNFTTIRDIQNKLNPLIDIIPDRYRGNAQSLLNGMEYNLDSYGGREGLIENAMTNKGLQSVFLADKGIDLTPIETVNRTEMKEGEKEYSEYLIDKLGRDNVVKWARMSGRDVFKEHGDEINKVFIEYFVETLPNTTVEEATEIVDSMKGLDKIRWIRTARDYALTNGVKEETTYDYDTPINNALDEKEYKKWLEETFSEDIISDTGLYNGKDIFTPSGNRRTFKQTHYPVSVENIVKAMLSQADDVRNTSGFVGLHSIRAVATPEFKSINDIKTAGKKIETIDTEEYNKYEEELSNRLSNVVHEIVTSTKGGSGNSFIDADTVGEDILEASTNPTPQNIKRVLEKYSWKVTDTQAKEISDIVNAVINMPVNMFEAKPQRVVNFNEGTLLIPDNASETVRNAIKDAGITTVYEYEAGNEDSRKATIDKIAEVQKGTKFSIQVIDISQVERENGDAFIPYSFRNAHIDSNDTVLQEEFLDVERAIALKNSKRIKNKEDLFYSDYVYSSNHVFAYENYDENSYNVIEITNVERRSNYGTNRSFEVGTNRQASEQGDRQDIGGRYNPVLQNGRRNSENDRLGRRAEGNYGRRSEDEKGGTFQRNSSENDTDEEELTRYSVEVDDVENVEYTPEQKEVNNIAAEGASILGKYDLSDMKIRDIAKELKETYPTNVSLNQISNSLKNIYSYLKENPSINSDDLISMAKNVTRPILENATEVNEVAYNNYKEFRDFIKSYKIKLSGNQKQAVAYAYDSYNNFRKQNLGNVTFSNDGVLLDTIWSEICDATGGVLSEDINDADMPMVLVDYMNSIKPLPTNVYGKDIDVAAYDMALDVYRRFMLAQANELSDGKMKSEIARKGAKILTEQARLKQRYAEQYKKAIAQAKREVAENKKATIERLSNDIARMSAEEREALGSNDLITQAEIKYTKEKYERQLDRVRKQRDDKIAELKVRQSNSRYKAAQRRKQTYLKDRIKKTMNELNSMLTHPTDSKHIPSELVHSVISVCEAVNLDSGRSKAMAERLDRLSTQYEALLKSYEYSEDTKAVLDDFMYQRILELKDKFNNGRSIYDMGTEELQSVYNIVNSIKIQLRNANRVIDNEKYSDAFETAKLVNAEIKDSRKYINGFTDKIDSYFTLHLNPMREAKKLSGYKYDGAFMSLFNQLNEGEVKSIQIQKEANNLFASVTEGKENQKEAKRLTSTKPADLVDIGLIDDKGNPVMVTRAMRLSLIMDSYNSSNMNHVLYGGFTVPNLKLYEKGKVSEAYRQGETYSYISYDKLLNAYKTNDFSEVDDIVNNTQKLIKNMEKELSDYEKKFLKCAKEFFFNYTGKQINETSYKLKGYPLARVENYFPIKTDPDFNKTKDFAGLIQDMSVANKGFTKERVKSRKPLILEDITNVILRTTNDVSMYCGYAIPIRNFNMVTNFTWHDNNGKLVSFRNTLKKTWGNNNVKFLENTLQNIQGARDNNGTWVDALANKLKGNFASSVLTLNLGVAMKQAASYPTAAAKVGYRPLVKALKDTGKGFITSKGIPELEAINPLLWNRTQANAELGSLKSESGFSAKLPKALQWIEFMDMGTVRTLEYASMYYVDLHNKSLEKGSKEYWKAVSDKFTEVVQETQPNYTVLQQANILKNGGALSKAIFMFKTQPMQNFGIVYDSVGELSARLRDYNNNKTEQTKAAVKKSYKNFAHAISSQIAAAATFAAMSIIASATKHNFHKFKDDDGKLDENLIEKYFYSGMVDTLLGGVLFGSEVKDAYDSIIKGEKYYGISVSLVDNISSTFENLAKLNEYYAKLDSPTEAERLKAQLNMKYYLQQVIYGVGNFTGVPIQNINNLIDSAILYSKDVEAGEFGVSENKRASDSPSQYMLIINALADGDMDKYEQYREEQEADDSKVMTNIKKYYKGGKIDEKTFRKALKNLGIDDAEIEKTMLTSETDIEGMSEDEALNKLIDAGMDKTEAFKTVQTKFYGKNNGQMIEKINEMIESNNTNGVELKNIITEYRNYGYDMGDVKQAITTEYKPRYLNASGSEKALIKNILITAYTLAGDKSADANKKINKWK